MERFAFSQAAKSKTFKQSDPPSVIAEQCIFGRLASSETGVLCAPQPEIRQQQRHQQKQPRHRRSCCNIVTEGAIWMASLLALTPPPASSSVRTLTTSGGGNLMLTAPPTHAEKTHALSI